MWNIKGQKLISFILKLLSYTMKASLVVGVVSGIEWKKINEDEKFNDRTKVNRAKSSSINMSEWSVNPETMITHKNT